MKKKTFAVIGLGKFGYAVAETLAKSGYEVLAVDGDNEKVQAIAPYASYPLSCRKSVGNNCRRGFGIFSVLDKLLHDFINPPKSH